MKKHILMAALALVIAAPAAAQAAPAQPAQTQAQHQGHDRSNMSPEEMARMGHGQQGGPQGQHQGHDMQGDCCGDRNGNGRMDCCENMTEGASCCAEHQPARPAAQPQTNR